MLECVCWRRFCLAIVVCSDYYRWKIEGVEEWGLGFLSFGV